MSGIQILITAPKAMIVAEVNVSWHEDCHVVDHHVADAEGYEDGEKDVLTGNVVEVCRCRNDRRTLLKLV